MMKLLLVKTIEPKLAPALLLPASLLAFAPDINLAGREDLVLGVETRQTVLEVGLKYLATDPETYASKIEDLTDPFSFEQEAESTPVTQEITDTEEPPEPVVYDDASVLNASAASFAERVRGSISRGAATFLQLEGGRLVRPGNSFPVRLPNVKGQTFEMTVTEISSDGYTLQIGDATRTLRFNNKSKPNSIQISNP
jgi:hypothetical protein